MSRRMETMAINLRVCSILLLFLTICGAEETTITVNTTLGRIKGLQMETRLGTKFWSFRGIRYAQPPVGELRFQNPQTVKSWEPAIFNATFDGPMCPQITENRKYMLSEDCLRLNIYTNNLNSPRGLMKPVVVYLHPGGFYLFSAISLDAGPQNFLDRDIVLVTLNYRLGSLGFLATGTEDAPGNMGLKDQVMALRWIREHISPFGGDPHSVTLWGYSAGGMSVGLHMMSPMSEGLFHRVILQSGSPVAQYRYESNQLDLAQKQAKLLKCPIRPIRDMIECLKTKPMMDFVDSTMGMFEFEMNPGLNWMPVVELQGCQEKFLIEDPYKSLLKGNIHRVPVITGVTEYEFYYGAYDSLRNETERKRFNENFAKYAPIYFFYERDTLKSQRISEEIRSFYFQNTTLEFPQSLKRFGEMYADVVGFQNHRFLNMVAKHVPVYSYFFTYKGRYSTFRNPETNQTHGAMHLDELWYLLYLPEVTPLFGRGDPENETVERLTRMWYEFAKKSDPNQPMDEYLKNIKWPLYNDRKKQYLQIGYELDVRQNGIFLERMQLWDRLFPLEDMVNKNL
ncbi:carboxylic ester hydrolase-like [Haematobia irritans]|uniref:carboxylic ester hydrolase-like n=1 Tax=Haematobia irritans TaxID=7368 RepID=UPI003F4FF09C